MAQTNVIDADHRLTDRVETSSRVPSLIDAQNLFAGGTINGARTAGCAFTIPDGLPAGWRCRITSESTQDAGSTTVIFGATYTVMGPGGTPAVPLTLLPGGSIDLEVLTSVAVDGTARILVIPSAGALAGSDGTTTATRTTLSTISPAARFNGMLVLVLTDNSLWRFVSGSAAAADFTGTAAIPLGAVSSANLVIVPATAGAGAQQGRWIRADKTFVARYAFLQATADNVALCTVPVGMALRVLGLPYIDFTRVVAGDGARRVGASGSFGSFGGNAGDFIGATQPAAGPVSGTLGADFAGAVGDTATFLLYQTCLIREAETITYDITAAGTGEADGMICVPVSLEYPTQTMIS